MKVRLAVSPTSYYLPIFLAADKGYFAKAGIDVDITKTPASVAVLYPSVAKGDLDIIPAVPAPGFYNQFAQGFDIKIIGGMGQEKVGRAAAVSLLVVKKQADQIKDFKDLKGKTIDGGTEGAPPSLTALSAIQLGGLTPGKDVNLVYKAKTPADMLAMATSGAEDVITAPEPVATQTVTQGLTVRWKTLAEVAPWYQPTFMAVSGQYLKSNPAATAKVLEVLLATEREIDATNGEWTQPLLDSANKWTGTPPDAIKATGGVVYYDPNGGVSVDSLVRSQDLWVQQGLVKDKVNAPSLVDNGPLDKALQELGKVNS